MLLPGWTFLTNHSRVLLCLARDPRIRLREIAACAKVTERTAHAIVDELVAAGYVTRRREGRRCSYEVHLDRPLRHEMDDEHEVRDLLSDLLEPGTTRKRKAA